MPRYGAKTYSRSLRAGSSSSKQFDELFDDSIVCRKPQTRSSPSKVVASPMKTLNTAGKQTVGGPTRNTAMGHLTTSAEKTDQSDLLSPKRRRLDSGSEDPFSFSSDEDIARSPIKEVVKVKANRKLTGMNFLSVQRQTRPGGTRAVGSSKILTRSSSTIKTVESTKPIDNKQSSIAYNSKKTKESDGHIAQRETASVHTIGGPNRTLSTTSSLNSNVRITKLQRTSTNSVESLSQVSNSSDASNSLYSISSTEESQNLDVNSAALQPSSSQEDAISLFSDSDFSQQTVPQPLPVSRNSQDSNSLLQTEYSATKTFCEAAYKPSEMKQISSSVDFGKDEFDFTDSDEGEEMAISAELNSQSFPHDDRKLHIPVKKIFHSPKKSPGKARYNARSWIAPKSPDVVEINSKSKFQAPSLGSVHSDPSNRASTSGYRHHGGRAEHQTRSRGLTRQVTYPTKVNHSIVTSLKCNKQEKGLYTVVQHVKQATQCQESGESQQYSDDIEFLRDGLEPLVSTSTRCLSTLSLVSKCSAPAFRLHLRAHGTISKLFAALRNADQFPSLALCTSGLMYMLSRDRLNMDLDRDSLDLLVRLLNVESQMTSGQFSQLQRQDYDRTKHKLRSTLEDIPNTCSMAKDLDLDGLSSEYLAMESLLSLTSRRAGEWFKEELRLVGGLDLIADTVISVGEHLSTLEPSSDTANLELIDRLSGCLRVFENVTFLNTENQQYLLELNDCSLVKAFASMLPCCAERVAYCSDEESKLKIGKEKSPGGRIRLCLLALLRVLLNITHDNEWGSMKVAEQLGLISNALYCVLQVAQHIARDQRFDLLVLSLGVLINLVEHCPGNAKILTNTKTNYSYDVRADNKFATAGEVFSLEALTQLFLQRYHAASRAEHPPEPGEEQQPEEEEDWSEAQAGLDWVEIETTGTGGGDNELTSEEIKRSVSKVLHTAGKHMEDSIVASYTALLIGCLVKDNQMNATLVRSFLPDSDFACMVQMLQKFLSFIELTNAAGNTGSKSISKIIEVLDHI